MAPPSDDEKNQRRGYRYRPADAKPVPPANAAADDDELDDLDDDDEFDDEDEAGGDEEQPSEFWPAAELLKGATITDAELELSYEASVYVGMPAAELRLWLKMADGSARMVQVDEPHAVWLYRQAHRSSDRDFEEYPDHRFELPSADLRALRTRRRRQLIDRQVALHEELVALGEELGELEGDINEEETETAKWPGTRWP